MVNFKEMASFGWHWSVFKFIRFQTACFALKFPHFSKAVTANHIFTMQKFPITMFTNSKIINLLLQK